MQWKVWEKRKVFLSEGSVVMGNIREWSNIFDLLYGTEFFSAVIYDDENEWYEVARTYSTEDWEDDKKIARMEAAEEYHARKK